MDKILKVNNRTIKVILPEQKSEVLSESDKNMDMRVKSAVAAAVNKAIVCQKPIAKYDFKSQKAYIEYTDGKIKYVK